MELQARSHQNLWFWYSKRGHFTSINDPRGRSTHFSFVDKSKTLREILDQLCHYDSRYSWSADGDSINIFPKETSHDSSYLMSHALSEVTIKDVDDPGQALTPLATLFRDQQIGYIGIGGDIRYPSPWTSTFRNLSVRQFINRISEHMGDRTFWIWQGGRDERLFTFVKGEFHL
jgi:hypothetical protein